MSRTMAVQLWLSPPCHHLSPVLPYHFHDPLRGADHRFSPNLSSSSVCFLSPESFPILSLCLPLSLSPHFFVPRHPLSGASLCHDARHPRSQGRRRSLHSLPLCGFPLSPIRLLDLSLGLWHFRLALTVSLGPLRRDFQPPGYPIPSLSLVTPLIHASLLAKSRRCLFPPLSRSAAQM